MDFGYDRDRFVNLNTDTFDCLVCSMIARDPKDCNICGNVFCTVCIEDWLKKKSECPNRCSKTDFRIEPIQRVARRLYSELRVKCEFCAKVLEIGELNKHESICKLPKCINYDTCGNILQQGTEMAEDKVCQLACLLLSKVKVAQTKDQLYSSIKLFVKEKQHLLQPQSQSVQMIQQQWPSNQSVQVQQSGSSIGQVFNWDKNRMGTGIQLSENDQLILLREQAYMFRTALAEMGFMNGCHYWEILADERTENELKIGVATKRDFNYNTAFCDFEYGWAYYGLGQLRHNSNATGQSFGKRFKKEGVLGIYLNMNKGTLSFSLNGELMGTPYTDLKLKKGPIYPAVSLLHCAGCKLITGKLIPAIFNNC